MNEYEDIEIVNPVVSLMDVVEEEAKWLIDGWIPEGQITVLAGDGGVGKTSIWVNIACALSAGEPSVLSEPTATGKRAQVLFLSAEDSLRKKLAKKLRDAGSHDIFLSTVDWAKYPELLARMKIGSEDFTKLIVGLQPRLCILDPLQAFIDPRVNMGSRNAMRDALSTLIPLGEYFGTSFLIVAHSNKRQNASGRDRISDSADIWDIARSVIMVGIGPDGQHYISNEKNNYAELQDTVLFKLDEKGLPVRTGITKKRDRDFRVFRPAEPGAQRADCKDFIVEALARNEDRMVLRELDAMLRREGYGDGVINRAKAELAAEKQIRRYAVGNGTDKRWYIETLPSPSP